ncbi:hypothetical protein F511_39018 [Dorcoceras hygrometricum]|uniref:Uncharacterized protein n=1 Tax=Dorcoceras hygrometricum TaxID=472368 RepID=A0A2Z7DHZ6_9LAMI|nr:hypothetical protein F511_39018 [Dorcoceras hygrometricum]
MAQYQILARKLHGLPGTGPKHNLEDKIAVTALTENRRTAAATITACGTRPHAGHAMRDRSRATVHDASARWPGQRATQRAAACGDIALRDGGRTLSAPCTDRYRAPPTCVTLNGSGIQLAVGSQPLRLRNHNLGLAHRIMIKRLATSPHDPLGITDSSCKNQLVVVSVQYGPFNTYIPIRSTTIVLWPEIYHTIISSDSIRYPRIQASDESSTTKHRLLHASGPHPIPPPKDPSESVNGSK